MALTPSPSPSPAVPTPALPAQINAATKKQHTQLNRLIVDRLSLALPPNASDPTVFGHGLYPLARIFFAFEDAWDELNNTRGDQSGRLSGTHDVQVRRWLADLRPVGLERSPRLKNDLQHISHRTSKFASFMMSVKWSVFDHIQAQVQAKPHVLIAYAWLANAGPEFWMGQPGIANVKFQLELPGFSFLSFNGDKDGEDINALLRSRLAEAETLLTQDEGQDVIEAAQDLFKSCIGLVDMLDWLVWSLKIWRRVWLCFACMISVGVLFIVVWLGRMLA